MSILEYEGFGLVATEAAASGGIVLAANLDGLKDAVMNNRIGFFFYDFLNYPLLDSNSDI